MQKVEKASLQHGQVQKVLQAKGCLTTFLL